MTHQLNTLMEQLNLNNLTQTSLTGMNIILTMGILTMGIVVICIYLDVLLMYQSAKIAIPLMAINIISVIALVYFLIITPTPVTMVVEQILLTTAEPNKTAIDSLILNTPTDLLITETTETIELQPMQNDTYLVGNNDDYKYTTGTIEISVGTISRSSNVIIKYDTEKPYLTKITHKTNKHIEQYFNNKIPFYFSNQKEFDKKQKEYNNIKDTEPEYIVHLKDPSQLLIQ